MSSPDGSATRTEPERRRFLSWLHERTVEERQARLNPAIGAGDETERLEGARTGNPLRRLVAIGVATAKATIRDDVPEMSAGLAYRFFLAIFPFAIFLAALGGLVSRTLGVENPAQQAVNAIGDTLPATASDAIVGELQQIVERSSAGFLSFGAIAAVFFATGGTLAVIRAMNRAYDVEESRPIWRRYAVAIGLTLVAAVGLLGAFLVFIAGQYLGETIATQLGLREAYVSVIGVARWPIAFAVLFVAVTILYRVAPNLRLPLRWAAVGAALFSLAWLAITAGFAFYVTNVADYGATFGALAGVAILLIWIYLTALVLLVCAELCAVLQTVADPDHLARQREASIGGAS